MALINATNYVGLLLSQGTTDITGTFFITLGMLFLILLALAMLFRIPIEWTAIFFIPFIIACMTYYKEFVVFGSMLAFYLALVITKYWIFK